jgi:hypothetical protein
MPIHFEDYSGRDFERMVFAYHARTERWLTLEWFGQQGKDGGRDILGVRESDVRKDGEVVCVLCANWQKLTLAKVKGDINKALEALASEPPVIRVVCGHDIPAGLRDKAKEHAQKKGVHRCELWSGNEFEEMIRANAESLLRRFCQGESFPDSAADLLMFAWGSIPTDDRERMALISRAFDRPAFGTPIWQESSLPAFRKAIDDSVQVLQTGIWQTRNNVVIRRLPAMSELEDEATRKALKLTLQRLVDLRHTFDALMRKEQIRHCECGNPECPTYMMSPKATQELSQARDRVIEAFRVACPEFTPSTGY